MDMKNKGGTNLHCLWNTRDWKPQLQDIAVRKELFSYLQGRGLQYGANIDLVNGGSEHIHCLLLNAKRDDVKHVVRKMRNDAQKWLINKGYPQITWDKSFIVFPVPEDDEKEEFRKYIRDQEAYHRTHSYAEELHCLLKQNIRVE